MKAIGLDEQLAEAHISLGNIKHFYDWDWAGAEQELKRALELDPGSLDAHYLLWRLTHASGAAQRSDQGRPDRRATGSAVVDGLSHLWAGFFTARADMRKPYRICSGRLNWSLGAVAANFRLGDVYAQMGRYDEAIAAFEKNRELMPRGKGFCRPESRTSMRSWAEQREAQQMISGLKAEPYSYCPCLRGARRQG